MMDAQIHDQAYQFFQQEALELLQILEDGLLALHDDQSTQQLHSLMRAAHSIKGGAASVGLPGIQKIAHKLEDVFRALYRREDPLDAELEEALLHGYDCLRLPLVEQIETGWFDADAAWQKAEPTFMVLEAVLANELGADFELPSSMELGIDIVSEVFSGDVDRGLTRLESVLAAPEQQPVAGEIRSMAEVFMGFGDLMGLAGFTAIAHQILEAVNAHPENALEIGHIAVENLREAQAAVLAGDRAEGGCPSPALLALSMSAIDAGDPFSELAMGSDFLDAVAELDWSALADPEMSVSEATDPLETAPLATDPLATDPEEVLLGLDTSWAVAESVAAEPTSMESEEPELSMFGHLEDLFGQVDLSQVEVEPTFSFTEMSVTEAPQITSEVEADVAAIVPVMETGIVPAPEPSAREVEERGALTIVETAEISVAPTPQIKPQPAAQPAAQRGETMRVELSRLERLNNLVGELVTQENASLLQSQQLQAKIKRLQGRFQQFEQLSKGLQDWMDKSQKASVRGSLVGHAATAHHNPLLQSVRPTIPSMDEFSVESADSIAGSETVFDALEMDSYSTLHTLMQEALEDIAQMGETVVDMALITQQSQQIQRQKQQTLKQVRNDLLWSRMIPIGDILQRFPRMVRDLSNKYQKRVNFKQAGSATLVDKAILEKLYDPLVHLVNNAFDHGSDSPTERSLKGKPGEATIEIRAYHQGNQTFIEVRDDGRGINPASVRSKVIQQELLDAETAHALSDEQLLQYLFAPGFSTKEEVSDISGRGMGLSSVQEQIKALKGSITIASELEKGTIFTIRLPLTLNIAKLMVFRVDTYSMAIPVDTLLSIIMAPDQDIQTIQGQQFYHYQEQLIPLFPPSIFASHYPLPRTLSDKQRAMTLPQGDKTPLLIITNGTEVIALEVDEILTEQELVIKPFGSLLSPPPYLYGCTILGDGTLVPVIDGAMLIDQRTNPTQTLPELGTTIPMPKATPKATHSILVIDDSLTVRNTLTLTLQKHGYQVFQAADGQEGMAILTHEPNIHAVFSDVEMPVMNGFEFLKACRNSHAATDLPVIMLTSRSSEKHKAIAKVLGASAYLTKPFIEKDLMQTLRELLA
jgi:two-component system, chemotaxis family, sensor histidine kinase and response regulator PixL